MSNSKLVDYTLISPHKNVMTNKVNNKITIHHMAGNLSIETCGNVFQNRRASSNYGVGTDGRVGMYVEEKDRSWASSSASNDKQAVTIEVANDEIGGIWHVSDTALAKLIELCIDICIRNDIEKLNYTGDENGNLTLHRMFTATACPGEYLMSKIPYIVDEVNKALSVKGKWKQNKNGWWYEYNDGTYPKDQWLKLEGSWYYFKSNGYAVCDDWYNVKDKWYYFDDTCRMVTGLRQIGDETYYFADDGHMCRTNNRGALV